MIPDREDAGAALLSILLIVATLSVAALMATEAITRQTEIHKLASRKTTALWAARSAEAIAISNAQNLVEASKVPASADGADRKAELALPVEGGNARLVLREQDPCLNLNALASSDPSVQLRTSGGLRILLEDVGMPTSDALRAVAVLSDWIDADHDVRLYGAEDAAYRALRLPHRPANQILRTMDELSAMPEFTPAVRAALAPFVCVLPHTDMAAINANALTPNLALMLRAATAGSLSANEARRFVDLRPSTGWADVQSIRENLAGRLEMEAALTGVPLSVQAQYISGEGTVFLDAGSWKFQFIMRAETGSTPTIVWREFGGMK
jgi:general secretion pathway protein K